MEKYIVKRGDTLSALARRLGIPLAKLLAANRQIKNPDKIFVGQFLNLPVEARHPVGSNAGPSLGDVFGQGAVPANGNPADDPRFVQTSIVAVGIPIWGGAFALYRRVIDQRGAEPIMLPRSEVFLTGDPLKSSFSEIRVLYSTRQFANAAIAASQFPNPYAYYLGEGGLLYPTIISDTSAPALCDALRKAAAQERSDAKAAEKLSVALLFWYVGARFPANTNSGAGKAAPAAAADSALAGFSAVEKGVITETRQILESPEMMQIRHAQALGKEITIKIGNRLVQYEPNWPWSGITNFEGNGFTMGRECFSSEGELEKTVLHELYRLTTSVARDTGGGGANNAETKAAFDFAERAYQAVFASPK